MDTIEYNGKKYPARTLTMKDGDEEFDRTIADATLSEAMRENSEHLQAPVEKAIDESIYFYVEAGQLELSAEVICKTLLDEPFEFVEEV